MSATPREIGTLIVVVLRANHLPNKRHIGKQDPYCAITVNGEKRRTKAIKRGGQHPEWDEEIRFTLFEDVDDVLARTAKGDGTPPPPPPKDSSNSKKLKKIKGGKILKLACYADDPREPELIGETDVDLTEVLTKGETDEWFTLTSKEKFAGKVYLELTFWSNEPPPEKKATPKPPKNNKQYAGPGSFVPAGDTGSPSSIPSSHSRPGSDVLPSSLRASSSGRLDLYVPPYERTSQMDNLANEFNDFGVSSQPRRRESFPPVPSTYSQAPYAAGYSGSTYAGSTYAGSTYSGSTIYGTHGYEPSLSDGASVYSYDPQLTNGQSSIHFPNNGPSHMQYPTYQQSAYEVSSPTNYHPPARGPRHSVPTASSGFMPIPQQSGFAPLQSHASEPSGFALPLSHTPAPGFTSQFHSPPQNGYPPPLSHTPAPIANGSYLQHSSSLSFQPQQSFQPSQSYDYSSFSIPASASAPPQQFLPPPTPQPNSYPPPHSNSAPPQMYPLPQDVSQGHTPPQSNTPFANGQGSRPLPPQPQVAYAPPQQGQQQTNQQGISPSHSLPQPLPPPPSTNSFSPTQASSGFSASNSYSSIPPPPPPLLQHNTGGQTIPATGMQLPVPPPPPPPLLSAPHAQPHRRASLPQPPVTYQQPAYQQQPPPPPPPPMDYYNHNQGPQPPPPPPPPLNATVNSQNAVYHSGLPKPPIPVDEHGQWIQPTSGYPSQAY